MKTPRLVVLLALCLLGARAPADVLPQPVDYTLADPSGGALPIKITEISDTQLSFLRLRDGARFSLPLDQLSATDRDFAQRTLAELRAKIVLPETPWLQAVRKDFQSFHADTRRLGPVPAQEFAHDRYFVVVQSTRPLPPAPAHRAGRGGADNDAPGDEDATGFGDLPVLWLFNDAEPVALELFGNDMPPRNFVLGLAPLSFAQQAAQKTHRAFVTDWSARTRGAATATPGEADVRLYQTKMRAALPAYWPGSPLRSSFGGSATASYPLYVLVRRDGQVVRFRGQEVRGAAATIQKLLADHRDELE